MKILGVKNVVDFKWNKKFHIPYKKYPKNLGYTPGTIIRSFTNRLSRNYDAVVVAAAKPDCFRQWLEVMDGISPDVPVVFVDGGDRPGIAEDLDRSGNFALYQQAVSRRPFDFIFKRELIKGNDYGANVFPFPISFNFDRLPELPTDKKYDVSFWAVETDPVRTQALEMLENKFDCQSNGTVRNQVFSKYKRKGDFYLQ